jgi:hypothetical protein
VLSAQISINTAYLFSLKMLDQCIVVWLDALTE